MLNMQLSEIHDSTHKAYSSDQPSNSLLFSHIPVYVMQFDYGITFCHPSRSGCSVPDLS